jgi:hypothetical protein
MGLTTITLVAINHDYDTSDSEASSWFVETTISIIESNKAVDIGKNSLLKKLKYHWLHQIHIPGYQTLLILIRKLCDQNNFSTHYHVI